MEYYLDAIRKCYNPQDCFNIFVVGIDSQEQINVLKMRFTNAVIYCFDRDPKKIPQIGYYSSNIFFQSLHYSNIYMLPFKPDVCIVNFHDKQKAIRTCFKYAKIICIVPGDLGLESVRKFKSIKKTSKYKLYENNNHNSL